MISAKKLSAFLILMVLTGLSACSITAKVWKPYDEITVATLANVNPDTYKRPSPIQIKIYELTSRATFDNLDFDRAFHNAKTLLSDQLLSEFEYTIQPNENIKHTINLQKGSAFIAIIAGFIDIDNTKWKHVYKVKDHGHYKHYITITDVEIKEGKPAKTLTTEDLKTEDLKKEDLKAEDLKKTIKQASETKEATKNLLSK